MPEELKEEEKSSQIDSGGPSSSSNENMPKNSLKFGGSAAIRQIQPRQLHPRVIMNIISEVNESVSKSSSDAVK